MAIIGWVGLGNMGRPMAANLVKAGHTVQGFDVVEAAVTAAAEDGITPAKSIEEAVNGAEIVFTMLPKGEHARSVYLTEGGVLEVASKDTILVDSSTIDFDTARALHDAAREAGYVFLDAPVSGGVTGAAAGTLTFMVGAEDEDFEAAKKYIEPMAGNIFHAGGDAAGQAAKIVNNMMLAISAQGRACPARRQSPPPWRSPGWGWATSLSTASPRVRTGHGVSGWNRSGTLPGR